MSHSFNQISLKIRAYLVTGIFIFYLVNIFAFPHTHIINGVTIVHSHIHSPFHHSNSSGNHTSAQLTLISHLSHYEANSHHTMSLDNIVPIKNLAPTLPEYRKMVSDWRLDFPILRAPPVLFES